MLRNSLIALAILIPFGLMIGCADRSAKVLPDSHPEIEYLNLVEGVAFVGDAACFDCHEDQYFGFQEHGMAKSLYEMTPEEAVEDFGSEVVVDSSSGLHYVTVAADSGFFMIEYLLDDDGNRTHELVRPIDYVMGSGISARTYLAEQDGWFYELPITWYTQNRRWDFSPGYRVRNQRFDRKIADRCMVCHNDYPTPVPQTNGMFTEMPMGIGCERCHGAGALHVEERLVSTLPDSVIDLTIVNPADLSLDLRLDVCQQCHLNGTVSLLREDATPYDFRPSHELSSFVSLFNGEDYLDAEGISVISHADRMKMSKCFTETVDTIRPLECTTCHDPHDGFRTEGPEYFNSTCLTCHAGNQLVAIDADGAIPVHTVDANCTDCHMPRADLIEAPHSTFTDHFIQIVSGEDELAPIKTSSETVLEAHFERDRTGSTDATLYEGMAYITRGYQSGKTEYLEKGISILAATLTEDSQMGEAHFLLGYGYVLQDRHAEAIQPLERSVRLGPDVAERLNALAQAYEYATGHDPTKIEKLYREALRVQPKLADVRLNLGSFLQRRGRMDEAMQEYEEVIRTESWNALGYYNLGTAQLQTGELEQAELNLKKALNLDPFYGGSMSNLGLVYLQQERTKEALSILETAAKRTPDHAESLENLGTLYLNLERLDEAIESFLSASNANPTSASVLAKLALTYFRAERYAEAQASAERALELTPGQPLAVQVMQAL